MRYHLLISVAALLTASAAAASDYAFTLHNRSSGWVISGFQTFQDGRWSRNWLDSRIRAGESVAMDWHSNEGSCVVPFRVQWVDYGSEEFRIDWCKGVSNIYMRDKGFSWD